MRILIIGMCVLLLASVAQADVVVTEIWPGGLDGAEVWSDWFELTNYGDTAVDPSGWYYDDDSADPTKNDPVLGLSTIAPGESVIVLVSWEDDWTTYDNALAAFNAGWDVDNALTNVQIGYVDGGSGLGGGGGGDEVWVFDSNASGANTIASQGYSNAQVESFVAQPDGTWNNDYAQVGVWGAYESAIDATSDPLVGKAVGSPGVVVPEPATLLLVVGATLMLRRR